MADNMTGGQMLIDPAPVICKLADRALHAKDPECSLLCEVRDMLMAAPLITHVEQRWIPVTEWLPEYPERVLVYVKEYNFSPRMIDTDRRHNGRWVRWNGCVTHWMPLPDAPEVK